MAGNNPKKRDCPALGRVIKRDECGRWRHTEVDCPADCPFNTFGPANYDAFLTGLEERLLGICMRENFATMSDTELRTLEKAILDGDEISAHITSARRTHGERDAEGRSLLARLLADPERRWKTDERTLLNRLDRMRVAFLEIRCIRDDLLVEAVDLLSAGGERITLCDRSLAATACRFDSLVAWIYPLPHYFRTLGLVLPFWPMGELNGWEVFLEIVRHHGGSLDTLRSDPLWLLEHVQAVHDTHAAVLSARRGKMLGGLEVWYWTGHYKNARPDAAQEILQRLDHLPDFVADRIMPEDNGSDPWETHRWTLLRGEAGLGGMRSTLGSILYSAPVGEWRIEAANTSRYGELKAAFETLAGNFVRFTGEDKRNFAAEIERGEDDHPVPDGLPARLLEDSPQLAIESFQIPAGHATPGEDLAILFFKEWLGREIPVLDGKTPVAALKDPKLRTRVISLVKMQINSLDRKNLESGGKADLADLLAPLDIAGIDEPPPPPRCIQKASNGRDAIDTAPAVAPLDALDADPEDFKIGIEEFDALPLEKKRELADVLIDETYKERPLSPGLRRPLSNRQIDQRLDEEMGHAASFPEAFQEISYGAGSGFVRMLREECTQLGIPPEAIGAIFMALDLAWICLVDRGHRIKRIDPGQFTWKIASLQKEVFKALHHKKVDDALNLLMKECLQPNVYSMAVSDFLSHMDKHWKDAEPDYPLCIDVFIFFRALVDLISGNLGPPRSR